MNTTLLEHLRLGFAAVLGAGLLLAASRATAGPIPTGLSHLEVGSGTNLITVFTYKPESYRDGPLVVVFHGLLRNAEVLPAPFGPAMMMIFFLYVIATCQSG